MTRKRFAVAIALVLIAALALAGCGRAKTQPADGSGGSVATGFKDTLVIGDAQGDPHGSWDPIDTFLVAWGTVASNIFEGLTSRGPELTLQPGLATSWKYLDDKTLEFTLRQGAKFHNGEPFNADAVVFTFQRLLGPEGEKSPQRGNYESIATVEKVDDYTVRFHLKNVDPTLLTKLAGYGGMIVPPKYIQEKGDAYFDTHPVGTGPYAVTEYTKDSRVVLKRFDDYWGEKAKTPNVIVRFIPEDTTRVAEFQTGAVDIMQNVPPSQVQSLSVDSNTQVIKVGGPTAFVLRLVTDKPPVNNVKVRQAIGYAVDTKTIIDTILGGLGKQISSFQGDISFGNNPDLKPIEFNPDKAKQLIQAAGAKGANLDFYFNSNSSVQKEIAQAIASELKDVGLNVTLHPVEFQTLISDLIPNGKAGHMYLSGWGGWTLDFDNTAYLLYTKGQKWDPDFGDPKIDELLKAERSTNDQSKRAEIFKEMTVRLRELMPDVPLYQGVEAWAVGKKVQGFTPPPDDRLWLVPVSVQQ